MYAVDHVDDKVDILNDIILSCINKHAPLKSCRLTRPPAAWLKSFNFSELRSERDKKRFYAQQTNSPTMWNEYKNLKNYIKRKIKETKKNFYKKALNSKKPAEIWKTVHRVLKPNPKPISFGPDKLNNHYVSTASQLLSSEPTSSEHIYETITNLPGNINGVEKFHIRPVSFYEVQCEFNLLRTDCSAGFDNISLQYLK